ncbi:MAG: hypothetical protein M1820_000999 [Bogoriella megaspora]|nr:MAG: hypothetical protein M1820_000999 [Bogoriella megaspora]
MRLINFIVALSGVALVASESQTLNNRDVTAGEAYDAQGVSSANELVPRAPKKACKRAEGGPSSRLVPRVLKKTQETAKVNGAWTLYEDEWVTAIKVKSGDKVTAVDVSGCTVAFFWNKDNVPSAYHFFCGSDVSDSKTAVADLEDMGSKVTPVHVTIAADGATKYNEIVTVIKKAFPDLTDSDFTNMVYSAGSLKKDERFRFDATAGSRSVVKKKVPQSECSRQKQRQGQASG